MTDHTVRRRNAEHSVGKWVVQQNVHEERLRRRARWRPPQVTTCRQRPERTPAASKKRLRRKKRVNSNCFGNTCATVCNEHMAEIATSVPDWCGEVT